MAQSELKRRQRQRDVLLKRLEDTEVQADEVLCKRIVDSLAETNERIAAEEQRAQQEPDGETRRRRR